MAHGSKVVSSQKPYRGQALRPHYTPISTKTAPVFITKTSTCTSENRFGLLVHPGGCQVGLSSYSYMRVEYKTLTGSFDAGAQPHGTPISATTTDDDTDIHI